MVTGGDDPLFEAIADALACNSLVAEHVIPGAGHRPQDTPEFNRFLDTMLQEAV